MIRKGNSLFLTANSYKDLILLTILLCFFTKSLINCDEINPYKVLGVSRNANEKQIRNAYRNLAKDWYFILLFLKKTVSFLNGL